MSGFGWFVHDGWMYIDTSLKLDHLTEILGSEYLAAQQAKINLKRRLSNVKP
ncbi:hypothetical protein MKR65_17375 [Acinetobacter baumannii]